MIVDSTLSIGRTIFDAVLLFVGLGAPPSGERGSFLLSAESRQSVARSRRFQSLVALAVGLLLVWYGLSQFLPGVPFVRFGL